MNGELAQTVVLTAFGNAALHNALSPTDESCLRQHPILCQHIRTIQFHEADAQDPPAAVFEWFQYLCDSDVQKLLLAGIGTSGELAPHLAEAFSNAIPRGIVAILDDGPIVFVPKWHFGRGQKWVVTYKAYQFSNSDLPESGDIPGSLRRLQCKIANAQGFASRAGHGHWAKWFDGALQALRTGHIEPQYLPSCGYSKDARRLLAGAASAWVFGGMGSWNDIWFEDKSLQSEYERVTKELYEAVSGGLATAANSFDKKEKSIQQAGRGERE